jgi:probable F420-dependent oxidoreductase
MSHQDLPPVIDDLSAFVIAGRVKPHPSPESETAARTPAQGIEDGVEAERIGFRRAFLSERWNLKEAAVILSGIAARTTRIDVGTGLVTPASRHPLHTAAFGSTMHACYGPRLVIGLGRGDNDVFKGMGLRAYSFDGFMDYVDIVRRLWAGEQVSYDGPAGTFGALALGDRHDGPDPLLWYGTFALPRGAAAAAQRFDGVLMPPTMTPDATAASVARLRDACERIDRDPATLRIAQCVITAPELDEIEMRQIVHARSLTYLQAPGYGLSLVRANGWDEGIIARLSEHEQLRGQDHIADSVFHRADLLEPAKLIPDEWMYESCAIGTVDECVAQLQRFRDAGADEIVTYGSTPGQNAGLAAAWAARGAAVAG